jgi:hypothetical protein
VVGELLAEDAQGAAEEAHGTVWQTAGATASNLAGPAVEQLPRIDGGAARGE